MNPNHDIESAIIPSSIHDETDANSEWNKEDTTAMFENKNVEKLAHRETCHVTYLRLGLLTTLLVASAATAAAVYLFIRNSEKQEFEAGFTSYGSKLTEAFQSIAERRLGAIAALSTSITSYALHANSTWPFVTIPQYEAQVRNVLKLANVDYMIFAPIVTSKDRKQWENEFVPNNVQAWRAESAGTDAIFNPKQNDNASFLQFPKDPRPMEPYEGMPDLSKGYSAQIAEGMITQQGIKLVISSGSGPFMPWWQYAPYELGASGGQINMDLGKDPTHDNDLIQMLSEQKAALGKLTTQGYGELNNPSSSFYYPVLSNIRYDSPLVASLGTLIRWLPYFTNVLPFNAKGFIGVISNTCNQVFTFRVDGSNVTYIGEGDQHDPKYDFLRQDVTFLDLINKSIEEKQYIGLTLHEEGCQYALSVHASSDMEDSYTSNKPVVYASVALMIFLVTSMLFLLYDHLVERRQSVVMQEAESSGAIVSSLFPATYRDRLMAAQKRNSNASTDNTKSNNTILSNFLRGSNLDIDILNEEPIADLFPECTVMFADIAGFTRWSSSREPTQVFCLLQEIFGEFDKIANRHRIFKVETIGDCYMAVTGLPNPQHNHARLMARFANECLVKMREIASRLNDKLGEGTGDLTLRIGLHSGPVTAGILGGEKCRFQLFGDTVNTASRMESTGEANRIQLSNCTADLIREDGKGHWLRAREDLVDAKGKGTLQTYWLVNELGKSTHTTCNNPISNVIASKDSSELQLNNDDNSDIVLDALYPPGTLSI